nr:reverse transcriptase domain-containing protein [Tanacetum cinerariifolium]
MVANQIRPLGFPPHQNNQNNFNRGNNFNQNRGGNFSQSNFNQSSFNQGQLNRPQVNQAPVYQAPIPQTQRVSQTDFESYVNANDAILRNIQSQGQSTQNQCQNIQNQCQNLQNQMATLTEMMSKLVSANTASSSGSVAPVSAPMPNLKPSISYPSRHDNEKLRDQANEQIEKFYEIFKEMSFEISFTDALILMSKFASTLKALIGNKEKLIWEGLSLPELTPTCMTLELAHRSVSKPLGIAKDVSFKVGVFYFPADFVVVDFEPNP